MLDFNSFPMLNVALLTFSALVTFFLLLGVFIAKINPKGFRKTFCLFLIAHILLQLGEAGMYYWGKAPEHLTLFSFSCFTTYTMEIFVLTLFTRCFEEYSKQTKQISLIPGTIVNIATFIIFLCSFLSLTNGMLFEITEQGECIAGPYNRLYDALYALCLVINIGLLLYYRHLLLKKTFASLLCYLVLPFPIIYIIDYSWYPTPVHLLMTLLLIVIFINFYSSMQAKLMEKENELLESKIAMMTSQIQPHFLYNSLNTIYHLCAIDAKMAQEAVEHFSEYLRCVLGSLNLTMPISFTQELRNVRAYLELEKLRFEDDLQIVYDIQATDFFVPALSVQILVENAVKHGICMKENGGTLTLRTLESATGYDIFVIDDGVGFALEDIAHDGRLHIGLQNARQRLAVMVGGTLDINSTPNIGTTVTIHLPKEIK